MHKYDFTCIFVVKLFTFVKPLTFLCKIKVRVYTVIYAYLKIAPYFCGYDNTTQFFLKIHVYG